MRLLVTALRKNRNKVLNFRKKIKNTLATSLTTTVIRTDTTPIAVSSLQSQKTSGSLDNLHVNDGCYYIDHNKNLLEKSTLITGIIHLISG